MIRVVSVINIRCLSFLSEVPDIHPVLFCRYLYRACQGTLFPSPVQMGRQLDKLPADTRRNILSLSRVKLGSPLSPFLSHSKPSPSACDKKVNQGPILQTEEDKGQQRPPGPTDSEKCLSDLYTLAPSEIDTLPYTKDAVPLSMEPQLPLTKDSEGLDKTSEPSDLSLSSWITSTPLLTQADCVQLNLPPDTALQCVKYTRNSKDRLKSEPTNYPAQRTELVAEQSLHTVL